MKKRKNFRKLILLFWLMLLLPFLVIGIMLIKAANSNLPTFEELENPKSNLATEVFSADNQVLGKYFQENRTNVRFEELPESLVQALIATEDERYYSHSGIDIQALLRVAKGVLTNNLSQGGGSTITQQLAKMLFHKRNKNIWEVINQKFQEWIIAVQLERQYTKEEIITLYLNRFDFVNNAVGVKSAAQVYFNTIPDSLTIEQCAMLVGMAKNPALYNPVRRPDTVMHRRMIVLKQMQKQDYITQEEYDSLRVLPLDLDFSRVDHAKGLAPYFREILRAELKDLFSDTLPTGLPRIMKEDSTFYNIYKDGLKIYTTIDSRLQRYAEQAVRKHLRNYLQPEFEKDLNGRSRTSRAKAPFDWRVTDKEIEQILTASIKQTPRYYEYKLRNLPWDSVWYYFNQPTEMTVFSWEGDIDTVMTPLDSIKYTKTFLRAGFMSMEPQTGFVKAWVGGPDFRYFKYDHVQQGKNQVGSTFKPFVYATAVREGLSPCTKVSNVVTCFDMPEGQEQWCPKNSSGKYEGIVSLKYGLAHSMNTITAWVMKRYGPEAVIKLAKDMGIKSELEPVPSLCLGTADLSLYELVGANSTFANKGIWIEPSIILRIEDKNGNTIYDAAPKANEAMDEVTAYSMLELMKGVVDYGSGNRLRRNYEYGKLTQPIAGKTGTTQSNSDGWFVGITPDLVSGVWVGGEDRSIRFSKNSLGQGAVMALPIWGYYMNQVYADTSLTISQEDFEKPASIDGNPFDCDETNLDPDAGFQDDESLNL